MHSSIGVENSAILILKALRTNVVFSQKVVIATAALFNFGRMLNDEPPDDGVDDEDFSADENDFVLLQLSTKASH